MEFLVKLLFLDYIFGKERYRRDMVFIFKYVKADCVVERFFFFFITL